MLLIPTYRPFYALSFYVVQLAKEICVFRAMKSREQLWWIAQHGEVVDLRIYLKLIGDTDVLRIAHDKSGDHVSHVLSRNGKVEMLKLLHRDWGVTIESPNLDGKVPLHEAASHGHIGLTEYLLGHVGNVDPLKHGGWTPLMMACAKSHVQIVKMLVEEGAKIQFENKVSIVSYVTLFVCDGCWAARIDKHVRLMLC